MNIEIREVSMPMPRAISASSTVARTFGTASLNSPDTVALTAGGVLNGMRGVTATGETWRVDDGLLLTFPRPQASSQ